MAPSLGEGPAIGAHTILHGQSCMVLGQPWWVVCARTCRVGSFFVFFHIVPQVLDC